jgi:autoinducer 2-degrading protein
MARFALAVTLKLKPGSSDNFIPLILENRRASLANESGCHEFKVMRNLEEIDTFHFYEEYDDVEAFKAHQDSSHFKAYFQAAKDMMAERIWKRCEVLE